MRILIPTDFSEYADAALGMASEIPDITEALILHVTEGKADGTVKGKLEEDQNLLSSHGITARIRIVEQIKEPIDAVIRSVAEEERIDCIVVGARGRGKVGKYLLGSVSDNLLLNVSRDLLIMQYPRYVKNSMHPDIFDNVLIPIELSSISYEILALSLIHISEPTRPY